MHPKSEKTRGDPGKVCYIDEKSSYLNQRLVLATRPDKSLRKRPQSNEYNYPLDKEADPPQKRHIKELSSVLKYNAIPSQAPHISYFNIFFTQQNLSQNKAFGSLLNQIMMVPLQRISENLPFQGGFVSSLGRQFMQNHENSTTYSDKTDESRSETVSKEKEKIRRMSDWAMGKEDDKLELHKRNMLADDQWKKPDPSKYLKKDDSDVEYKFETVKKDKNRHENFFNTLRKYMIKKYSSSPKKFMISLAIQYLSDNTKSYSSQKAKANFLLIGKDENPIILEIKKIIQREMQGEFLDDENFDPIVESSSKMDPNNAKFLILNKEKICSKLLDPENKIKYDFVFVSVVKKSDSKYSL